MVSKPLVLGKNLKGKECELGILRSSWGKIFRKIPIH